jgi:hypothetical protein
MRRLGLWIWGKAAGRDGDWARQIDVRIAIEQNVFVMFALRVRDAG